MKPTKKLKIATIFGTRPEAIKIAPVIRELELQQEFVESKVVVTAQHREMLDQVLKIFGIIPHYDLGIMKPCQNLFDVTVAALSGLGKVLQELKPDLVLVQGDTTTALTGALAAFYLQIPLGHIEAGLRTYNKYAPFPEETNRVLITHLADLHFAPTGKARQYLLKEGIPREKIFITGNTVVDALHLVLKQGIKLADEFEQVFQKNRRVLLVTTHRRENLGEGLRGVYVALRKLLNKYPDLGVIFPVHKNPLVREEVAKWLEGADRVYLSEPLEYLPFVQVMQKSYIVLTDSGGLQEEAPALGKPVLVLREVTERPEALEAGTATLVGTDQNRIFNEVSRLLDDSAAYEKMAKAVNPFGDGSASERIVQAVLAYFGEGVFPKDFFSM